MAHKKWPQLPVQHAAHYCKGLTTSVAEFGIVCTSRYGVPAELRLMNAISKLLVANRDPVTAIYCNSKTGFAFVVQLSVPDIGVAHDVGCFIGCVVAHVYGGHNGITLMCGDVVLATLSAAWPARDELRRRRRR